MTDIQWRYDHESVEEFARVSNGIKPTWGHTSTDSPGSWSPIGFADTIRHAVEGWPEGIEKMQRCAELIKQANIFQPKPELVLDVAGAYPIVPIAIAGDPFCMVDKRPNLQRNHPVLHFHINLSANCSWSAEQIENYGGALLAWIDYLETMGFSVQLDGYMLVSTYGSAPYLLVETGIKRSNEPLDLNRLAFALVHPGVIRRLLFRHIEAKPEYSVFGGGYGSPRVMPEDSRSPDRLYLAGKDRGLNRQCDTVDGAVRLLREQIAKACKDNGLPLDLTGALSEAEADVATPPPAPRPRLPVPPKVRRRRRRRF